MVNPQVRGVPLSTVIRMVEPGATRTPGSGPWLITCPGSMQAARYEMLATNPVAVRVRVASARLRECRAGLRRRRVGW